jgi:hypothetical protein
VHRACGITYECHYSVLDRCLTESVVEMLNVGLAIFVETLGIPYWEVKSIVYLQKEVRVIGESLALLSSNLRLI